MRVSLVRSCCLGLLVLFTSAAYAQSQPGNMMKMTISMKMQIPGMGSVPAQTVTQNVCTAKDPDMRAMMEEQKDCAITNYKKVGNVVSYHVTCGGNSPTMSGDAQFELRPDGSINGSIKATTNMSGQSVAMDMTYAGVRTGSCEYTPPAHGQ